jgi:hypothetical protein
MKTHNKSSKILLIVFYSSLLLSLSGIGQTVQWAKTTASGYANVNDIITDAAGNTYVLGDFNGTINLSPFSLSSGGSFDGYLCKRDASGTVLWATRIATGLNEERVRGMAMDASGNIYVGGDFVGTSSFGSTSLTSNSSSRDMVIIKVDAFGSVSWAKRNGGTGDEYVRDIVVSADGNDAYFTGDFTGTSGFGASVPSNGFSDLYVARITYNGIFGLFNRFGGTGSEQGNAITIDASNNIYLTGSIGALTVFGTYSLTPSAKDIFIAKLPASNFNNVTWANNYGSSGNDFGNDITLDAGASVYATGSFDGAVNFGSIGLSSTSVADMFVVKLNATGVAQWAKSGGGIGDDAGNKIAVNTATDVVVSGTIRNSAVFGGSSVGNAGLNDIFVAKLSPAGVFRWVISGGGSGNDFGTAVAANSTDVFAGGGYNIAASFGSFNLSGNNNEAYELKISLCTATTKTVTATACSNYLLNAQTYTATGVYTQTLTNSKGCDSLLTLNLTVNQPTSRSITQTSCSSFAINSQTFTSSGVYTQTLINSKGCDSLLTINLTINQPTSRSITQTSCSSFAINSQTFTSSGVYTQTLTNSKGCDSLLTLNLTINQPTSRSITQTSCSSFAINSQTYTTSGVYTQTLTNSKGCDSLLTINLTINQPTSRSITQIACGSFAVNSQTYTSSGVYTQTLTNSKGCDSLLTINLTINQPTSASMTHTACGSFAVNSQTFTSSGVYTQTLTNSKGCDSLLTLNLTIHQPTSHSITDVACDTYTLNSQVYAASGAYTQTLTNTAGCDSIITLNLTITSIDNTITQNGLILTANETGAGYQWLDCDNANLPISGATAQSFTVTVNGNYAVSITKNSCNKVSACANISTVGMTERSNAAFRIYPNPSNGMVTVNLPATSATGSLKIYDVTGQLVLMTDLKEKNNQIDLSSYSNGIYLLELEQNGALSRIRLIKN